MSTGIVLVFAHTSTPTTAACRRSTMGKKNDFEASGIGTKKSERAHRVPLPVSVARLMHAN
jgi:hypothetical protein